MVGTILVVSDISGDIMVAVNLAVRYTTKKIFKL